MEGLNCKHSNFIFWWQNRLFVFLSLQHLLHLLQTSWSPAILVRDTGLVPPAVHSQTRWFSSHCRQCWGGDCSVAAGAGSTRATEACMCCIVDADPGLRPSVVEWFLSISNHLMKRYNHGHFIQSLQIQFSYFLQYSHTVPFSPASPEILACSWCW